MSPAGIASNESGIYNDYVAVQLRSMTAENVQDFILDEAKLIEDFDSQEKIRMIFIESRLRGAKVGLAYGISAGATKQQFMSYLKGLEAGKSFCLITPSKFDQSDIVDPELRQRVVVVNSEDKLPWNAEPGKIYIVKTKTLPHKVFVGLMAYSMKKGLVPVGAGDGFMSAAINLGGPFVLTKVAWNAKNIANLKQRLLAIAKKLYTDPAHIALVESLFDSVYGKINMNRAQDLQPLAQLFARLSEEVPDLSERIMDAAVVVHEAAKSKPDTNEKAHLAKVPDETLRKSIEAGGIAGAIKTTAELADMLKISFDLYLSDAGASKEEFLKAYKKYFDGLGAGQGAGSLTPFDFSLHDFEPLHHNKIGFLAQDSNSETASVNVDPSKKAMAEIINIYFSKNKDNKLPIESQLGKDWINNKFESKKMKPFKPLTLDEAFKIFEKTSEDLKKAELLYKIDKLVFYDPKAPSDKNYPKYDKVEYFKEFSKKFKDSLKNSSKNQCVEFYKM